MIASCEGDTRAVCPHCAGSTKVTCCECRDTRVIWWMSHLRIAMGNVWARPGCDCGACKRLPYAMKEVA